MKKRDIGAAADAHAMTLLRLKHVVPFLREMIEPQVIAWSHKFSYLFIIIYCGAKVGAVNGVNGWRPVKNIKRENLRATHSFIKFHSHYILGHSSKRTEKKGI